jgi:DNA replication and repair protein RecF
MAIQAETVANAMQVKQVSLTNFRNYSSQAVSLAPGKTILIGANAQGKSNFFEALELISTGRSQRATQDADLIAWGADRLAVEAEFERGGAAESIAVFFMRGQGKTKALSRQIKVNGVSYPHMKALLGHLVAVSFQTQDLDLLRGGPKDRRDWIDTVILRLRPAFNDIFTSLQKVVAQRNRLLKTLFEKGRVTVSDADELLAWDKQLARFAARVVKERMSVISSLLPLAQKHQGHLSGARETLTADYLFKAPETRVSEDEDGEPAPTAPAAALTMEALIAADEREVAITVMRLLKERRGEEIARRQTLIGPHRDDVVFRLNEASAVNFASQGQQRSLVLSLKLAEMECLEQALGESPILLLDDVMAELDATRQGLLISAVGPQTQMIITTTHLSGFDPSWLEGASIYSVAGGQISLLAMQRNP